MHGAAVSVRPVLSLRVQYSALSLADHDMSRKIAEQQPGSSGVLTAVIPFDVPGTASAGSSRPIGGVASKPLPPPKYTVRPARRRARRRPRRASAGSVKYCGVTSARAAGAAAARASPATARPVIRRRMEAIICRDRSRRPPRQPRIGGWMPQIDAPTVAEHRAQQRESLLDAAEAILLEAGHGALTFRALGERTGLARNSIYRYFSSRDDLIAALCERDMPRWLEELETAMAAADGPDARVAAFVSTQLRLVAHGSHRMAQLLGDAPLGPGRARADQRARLPARRAAGARARAPRTRSCGPARPGRRQRGRAAAARRGDARARSSR